MIVGKRVLGEQTQLKSNLSAELKTNYTQTEDLDSAERFMQRLECDLS